MADEPIRHQHYNFYECLECWRFLQMRWYNFLKNKGNTFEEILATTGAL